MAVDTGQHFSTIDPATPGSGDDVSEGEDNFQHIKGVMQRDFPNVGGAVQATHTELDYCNVTTLGTAQDGKALTIKGDSTWTVAGMTCADLGTVTTASFTDATFTDATLTQFDIGGTTFTGVTTDISASATSGEIPRADATKSYVDKKTFAFDEVATTSGTDHELIADLSDVRVIELGWNAVQNSSSGDSLLQLKAGGSYVTTGYVNSRGAYTTGVYLGGYGAGVDVYGRLRLHRLGTTNTWIAEGGLWAVGVPNTTVDSQIWSYGGYIALAGAAQAIKLTCSTAFSGGAVSVAYSG